MPHRYSFSENVLHSVAGGGSSLDLPRLSLYSVKEANEFIKAYGFDMQSEDDRERLWQIHRRALVFLVQKLNFLESEIPVEIKDRKLLGEMSQLLILASSQQPELRNLQRWACAVLRVIHVFVHTETDLFSAFSEEIQKQILTPVQESIVNDGLSGRTFLRRKDGEARDLEPLPLVAFEVKAFKTSSSSVIKLLAKSDALALNVFDRLGFRFVTENMFDVFRVIRFLVEEGFISAPHIIPDQSTNTIYPVSLFCQVAEDLQSRKLTLRGEDLDEHFRKELERRGEEISFLRKENQFSGNDYRFIKFIARQMVSVPMKGSSTGFLKFFFPFEIQIMDKKSHASILSGPSQHGAYKDRQVLAARKRVFPG